MGAYRFHVVVVFYARQTQNNTFTWETIRIGPSLKQPYGTYNNMVRPDKKQKVTSTNVWEICSKQLVYIRRESIRIVYTTPTVTVSQNHNWISDSWPRPCKVVPSLLAQLTPPTKIIAYLCIVYSVIGNQKCGRRCLLCGAYCFFNAASILFIKNYICLRKRIEHIYLIDDCNLMWFLCQNKTE